MAAAEETGSLLHSSGLQIDVSGTPRGGRALPDADDGDDSIGAAGRQLVRERLGERTYGDPIKEPAAKFFTDCYDLRSRLTHGHPPQPTFNEVNGRTAGLELMVSDLLSGELLTTFDLESWTPPE